MNKTGDEYMENSIDHKQANPDIAHKVFLLTDNEIVNINGVRFVKDIVAIKMNPNGEIYDFVFADKVCPVCQRMYYEGENICRKCTTELKRIKVSSSSYNESTKEFEIKGTVE